MQPGDWKEKVGSKKKKTGSISCLGWIFQVANKTRWKQLEGLVSICMFWTHFLLYCTHVGWQSYAKSKAILFQITLKAHPSAQILDEPIIKAEKCFQLLFKDLRISWIPEGSELLW